MFPEKKIMISEGSCDT